ncbi:hypothetical protein LTR97_010360 [Elasticomyces elasticus]|uniref:2EXR domain-containing protein n=1 Tax=Elasticomyces elasticus TaxID=574655 RepID=A0AAN7W0F7_9PEZI|nr:hypothetical protein LTR97_010360 [Elasticomyces elasticus]
MAGFSAHLRQLSHRVLAVLCRERGIKTAGEAKATLAARLSKYTNQAVVYDGFSTTALLKRVDKRGLDYSDAASNADLIKVLEEADKARTFHRFEKLPAELRNMVYAYAMNDVVDAALLGHPSRVPAICQTSKETTRESLSVFYGAEYGEAMLQTQKAIASRFKRASECKRWLAGHSKAVQSAAGSVRNRRLLMRYQQRQMN